MVSPCAPGSFSDLPRFQQVTDIYDLPFEDQQFDTVLCSHTIEHVDDPELAHFYRSLFESEARHHTTYTRLAKHFAPEEQVNNRLEELYAAESIIIATGEPRARMHS